MRYCVVPFFDYGQGNNGVLWKFFLLHAVKWIKYVDRLFVIDSGCNLEVPISAPLKLDKITIIKRPPQSHWQNMNETLTPLLQKDYILLLDSDMVIYDPDIINFGFEQLERGNCDVMAILDSSGSKTINHPLFKENNDRAERRRISPYFCFLKKCVLRSNFDFTPRGGENWTDSMGVITEQFAEDNIKIWELQDDRSTISLEDDGRITSVQWLDTPPKKWALEENPNLGYYHIRNFGGGLKILKEGNFGLVPGREARRLLMWVYILSDIVKQSITEKKEVLWHQYYNEFRKYHLWLDKFYE